jgi:hypothetical protein
MAGSVAVLFARTDSVCKTLHCDVYDAARDVRKWPGGCPIVAHPPCRAWGQLRHFAQPLPGEKELALWAVTQVRRWGGLLEHPARSTLWPTAGLPEPGARDAWGGWTLFVDQFWWGHRARKRTRWYVVGCAPGILGSSGRRRDGTRRVGRIEIPKAEREHTLREFARWLIDLAGRCVSPGQQIGSNNVPFDRPSHPADGYARGGERWDKSAGTPGVEAELIARRSCTMVLPPHGHAHHVEMMIVRPGYTLPTARGRPTPRGPDRG